jgi:ribosomal protein S1
MMGRPSFGIRQLSRGRVAMMSDAEASPEAAAVAAPVAESAPSSSAKKVDSGFSQFAVGQEYTGSLVGAKNFGLFVNINKGTNVLLPRSQMSRGAYEKLKRMVDTKSKDEIKLEIIGVSAENSTLSGKFVPLTALKEVSLLQKAEKGATYDATVVGAHDFGIFAELDEYGVEGLVPASKLPDKLPAGTIQASYP